nr:MAG TPA: hypothetical protein [Caudoviricetes sp.]
MDLYRSFVNCLGFYEKFLRRIMKHYRPLKPPVYPLKTF